MCCLFVLGINPGAVVWGIARHPLAQVVGISIDKMLHLDVVYLLGGALRDF